MLRYLSIVSLWTGLATGLAAGPAFAVTPNPTPNLRTGDYQAKWGIVSVGNPSAYGRNNVSANVYPTTVHYDAVSGTYVVNDGQQNISFSRMEYVAAKSSAAYTYYRDAATGATLKLLNQSGTNPVIALTYVTYGKWTPVAQAPIVLNDNYVVFGSITPASAVPRSGSASYNFILDGTWQQAGSTSGKTYSMAGNGRLVANFANATMGLTVTPVATNLTNGSQIQFGTLTGGGFIDASTSSWNATSRTRAADGTKTLFSANGNFFGPSAQEIGGAFTLARTLGTQEIGAGAGALVGRRN
jgi:C-lobe and N-lobe beta barrels of Tf-binding protein B